MFGTLALRSLWSRKYSVLLTVLAVAVSAFVLLGVEHIRHQAKHSFNSAVSGVDLIVGTRTSDINLLLYSVFHVGNATNDITWNTYQHIAKQPDVAWTIPISLGDSHRGYRVVGTTDAFFNHFRFGEKQALTFTSGAPFKGTFDAVLGAKVALDLGYTLDRELILSHGVGSTSFTKHTGNPFRVVGILAPTGTSIDQSLYVSLEAIEAIHKPPEAKQLQPSTITAFFVGLKSKMATFKLQRTINQFSKEPLSALLPGVALSQLWQMMGTLERVLGVISILVLISALLGLSAMLLTSIRERQREIALMRAIGGSPLFIFALIQAEALFITLIGTLLGVFCLFNVLVVFGDYLAQTYGIFVGANIFNLRTAYFVLLILLSSVVVATIPAIFAYFNALQSRLARR